MGKKLKCRNEVLVSGVVTKEFEFDHYEDGVKFFICEIQCKRKSGTYDLIKVMASEYIVSSETWLGRDIEVYGEYHTFNDKKSLKSFVYAKKIYKHISQDWDNQVVLRGYISTVPKYRNPSGRNVCSLILAVNRGETADFIPVVFWGKDAKAAANFRRKRMIEVYGRLQSRTYLKETDEGFVEKMCWEVSVQKYREEM